MAQERKLLRHRVQIGVHSDGKPDYRWVQGWTLEELFDSVVRTYVDNGLIWKFMDKPGAVEKPVQAVSFEAYTMHWFTVYKAGLKATSKKDYLYILNHYLIPAFGKMALHEITTDQIQMLFNKHSALAKSTIDKMQLTLHQIFKAAVKDGKLPENPVDKDRLKNPSKVVNKRDALPEADYYDVLGNLHRLEDQDRIMIAVLALTGARRGEALGLRWEDIDFDEGLIHIRRNVNFPDDNQPVIDTLKTESGYRSIPLDKRLRQHLLSLPQREGFVIGGDSPLSKSAYDKAMKRIRKTIDLHGATAHIFRHTYATMLSIAGVDPKTIQYIMGHADISTTMNRYVHANMDRVKRAGDLLCALQSA